MTNAISLQKDFLTFACAKSTVCKVARLMSEHWKKILFGACVVAAGFYLYSSWQACRIFILEPSDKKFEDLFCNVTKKQFEMTIDFLKGSSEFGTQSFLLTGPECSGKKHVAYAVSQEAQAPIIEIDCSEDPSFLSVKIQSAFAAAKLLGQLKGCVILLKRMDLLTPQSLFLVQEASIKQPNQALEQFEKELQQLAKSDRVAVFATARSKNSDVAELPFQEKIPLSTPSYADRCKILSDLSDHEKWAKKTIGWNHGDLKCFVSLAQKALNQIDDTFQKLKQKIDNKRNAELEKINAMGPGTFLSVKDKSFDDIAGNEEAKEELLKIQRYLTHPEDYTVAPKGIIMHGEPGTGKTVLAGALATSVNCPVLCVEGSLADKYVGSAGQNMNKLFAQAKATGGPCIIFMDEIDQVGTRTDGMEGQVTSARELILAFTQQTDGLIKWPHPIILIGATNRINSLDKAFTRPGRFDYIIKVNLPTKKERFDILQIHAKDFPIGDDVDLQQIADTTRGYTGAQLRQLLKNAYFSSKYKGESKISHSYLFEAYQASCLGSKVTTERSDKEITSTAAHEIGHALVAVKHDLPFHGVSIRSRGDAAGATFTGFEEGETPNNCDLKKHVQMLLASQIAEEIIANEGESYSVGCENDRERAQKHVDDMILKYGYGSRKPRYPEKPSKKLREQSEAEIDALFNECLDAAKRIVTKERIEKVLETLKTKEVLMPDEFKRLCGPLD